MNLPSQTMRIAGALSTSLLVGGCVSSVAELSSVHHHPNEASVIYTSPVRTGVTPLSEPLACFGERLKSARNRPLGIAIGDVKDYTGKQGQDEGFAITQGGALMAYSALGKLGSGIRVHERFDTRIAEAELVYMNQRQLGDGNYHAVDDPSEPDGRRSVPWKPYYGGTIRQSDYFIVGGITELNFNIQSGGGEFAVNNVGPKARLYTMNIAVDLRIVGSQSLMVYDTVSVEKQLTGYEVGFGIFRFFGSNLFDVNVGAKNAEPLQLGVRMAIEAAVLQLVATVAGVDPTPCVPPELGPIKWDAVNAAAVSAQARQEAASLIPPSAPDHAQTGQAAREHGYAELPERLTGDSDPFDALEPATLAQRGQAADGGEFSLAFAPGSTQLDQSAAATVRWVASLVRGGRSVNLTIGSRNRAGEATDRLEALRNERIQAVVIALGQEGVARDELRLLWKAAGGAPLMSAASVDGSPTDLREIARIRIG